MNNHNQRSELLKLLLSKTITEEVYNDRLDKLLQTNNVSNSNNTLFQNKFEKNL